MVYREEAGTVRIEVSRPLASQKREILVVVRDMGQRRRQNLHLCLHQPKLWQDSGRGGKHVDFHLYNSVYLFSYIVPFDLTELYGTYERYSGVFFSESSPASLARYSRPKAPYFFYAGQFGKHYFYTNTD